MGNEPSTPENNDLGPPITGGNKSIDFLTNQNEPNDFDDEEDEYPSRMAVDREPGPSFDDDDSMQSQTSLEDENHSDQNQLRRASLSSVTHGGSRQHHRHH